MVYFLISGCLQPLFARALFYEGITRIAVARAGPLRGAEPLFATIITIGQGDLSVIIPLLNTTPLFTVLFSGLFLRSLETLSPRIVVGASLMVGGVVLITLR